MWKQNSNNITQPFITIGHVSMVLYDYESTPPGESHMSNALSTCAALFLSGYEVFISATPHSDVFAVAIKDDMMRKISRTGVYTEGAVPPKWQYRKKMRQPLRPKIGRNQELVLSTLKNLGPGISVEDLITETVKRMPLMGEGRRDRRMDIVVRAVEDLASRKLIVLPENIERARQELAKLSAGGPDDDLI
jgi:hypothetical protein